MIRIDLREQSGMRGKAALQAGDTDQVLAEWRSKILSRILYVGAFVAAPAWVLVVMAFRKEPSVWPYAIVLSILFALLILLALLRGIKSRYRALIFLLIGYAAATVNLMVGGILSAAPWYLLVLPTVAFILIGMRAGILGSLISALLMATSLILSDLGWLRLAGREVSPWAGFSTLVMLLSMVMALQMLFHRLLVQMIERERSARGALLKAQAQLEQRNVSLEQQVELRTGELAGATRQAQREKQYSEALIQNSPVAIVSTDAAANVATWNPAAEQLFGYTRSEALGRNLDALVTTPDLLDEAIGLTETSRREGRAHVVTQRRRRDETLVDVEVLAVPADVDDPGAGLIAIYHDISELKRTAEALAQAKETAEAATQAKSAFLATMSHEIRTPMNAIIGMAGLLMDTPLDADQHEFAETIRSSGDALLTIINDILDFSKMEAGKMDLEQQPFDLRECVESALDLMKLKASEKGLELACEIAADVPPAVSGDVTRLRQVLVNLLSNAVKFTEQGEVVVTVTRDTKTRGDGDTETRRHGDGFSASLHFVVRDTGIGIPAGRLNRLFRAFSQVDSSTTRKYGGTGLGLAVSKRLSELMGGTMWVESPPSIPPASGGEAREGGPGSAFHFTIRAPVAADAQALPALHAEAPELRGRRVLIVDDNATNRRILTLETERWGMQVRATGSPHEALAWVRQEAPFELAIVDLQMPEMDGVELAQALRAAPAAPASLILLSSLGGYGQEIPAGLFAACLTKPIRASSLFDALLGILGPSAQQAAVPAAPARPALCAEMAGRLPLRILIAEDNVVNQKLALRLLAQMGYRASVAANGLEAIQALERQPYDVILMDVQMPEMDGLEATQQICTCWPVDERPRIIAMTASAMQGDREMCLAAGMNDYVSKPIRVDELVQALGRCQRLASNPAAVGAEMG